MESLVEAENNGHWMKKILVKLSNERILSKDYVTSPLVGATKIKYLEDAAGALDVKLTPEEIAYLEEPYVPHKIVGYK